MTNYPQSEGYERVTEKPLTTYAVYNTGSSIFSMGGKMITHVGEIVAVTNYVRFSNA